MQINLPLLKLNVTSLQIDFPPLQINFPSLHINFRLIQINPPLWQVLVCDVASGRRVRQLAGTAFALMEGLSGEHQGDQQHILTASGDTLRIYECTKEPQHGEDGAAAPSSPWRASVASSPVASFRAEPPVASFRAPGDIVSVRCHGSAICVGCGGGALCILSAPFLAS